MKYNLLFVLLVSRCCALAQAQGELQAGYYTVVAAYSENRGDYAQLFAKSLQAKGHPAQYGLNSSRKMYFVYLQTHTTLKEALNDMYSLRGKGEFTDAWVRVVPGVIGQPGDPARPVVVIAEENPISEKPKETAIEESTSKPVIPIEEKRPEEVKPVPAPATEKTVEPTATVEEEEKLVQHYPMTLGNSEIFLSLFDAATNRIVDGDVQVIDAERGRLLKTVHGNEYLSLPDPKNESGKVSLICDVFGYRKMQLEINYKNPEADTVLAHMDLMGLSFVVTFDLVRYRKGDVRTMSHVYFYNDAAIMLPESRYEVNQLLQMMNENPNMKIRLHGHTNGHYHGKIVKMGPEKNFFAVGNDAVSTVGSAKNLSFERAEIIKNYLIANNVAENRIEVRGWGGKKPLYDKHGANARKNVRVEVEVIAN
jgi:outer membrane protein OmpA-like peptidoglycan-associated protein